MKRRRVLFISNGHGEDTISCCLMRELRRREPRLELAAFPLVGSGEVFQRAGISLRGPATDAPRHGFGRNTFEVFVGLLRGKSPLLTPGQRVLADQLRGQFQLAVAVGDSIPAMVARWLELPYLFVGANKSQYYRNRGRRYLWVERGLLRRALKAFVRDTPTARALASAGLTNVVCAGNPMMDCLTASEDEMLVEPGNGRLIALLPGSYQDAFLNMEDLLRVAGDLKRLAAGEELHFAIAATEQVTRESAAQQEFVDWTFNVNDACGVPLQGVWRDNTVSVPLFNRGFREILSASELVLGLAGTANEQAAGLGIPVVSFPSRGVQYTRRFGTYQQQLLGEALAFLPDGPAGAAEKAWQILNCPVTCQRMAAAGRERMETSGAAGAMAETILESLEQLDPGMDQSSKATAAST